MCCENQPHTVTPNCYCPPPPHTHTHKHTPPRSRLYNRMVCASCLLRWSCDLNSGEAIGSCNVKECCARHQRKDEPRQQGELLLHSPLICGIWSLANASFHQSDLCEAMRMTGKTSSHLLSGVRPVSRRADTTTAMSGHAAVRNRSDCDGRTTEVRSKLRSSVWPQEGALMSNQQHTTHSAGVLCPD
jgi:hypothetical protein